MRIMVAIAATLMIAAPARAQVRDYLPDYALDSYDQAGPESRDAYESRHQEHEEDLDDVEDDQRQLQADLAQMDKETDARQRESDEFTARLYGTPR